MNKRKICVVVTARPSYSRIKTVLRSINEHKTLDLQLVLAGSTVLSKYGDVSKIVEDDGFHISEKLYCMIDGDSPTSMAKSTGLSVMDLSNVFAKLQPDLVITIADRFETLATSIASSYQNIPLAHIQGGEVTGSIDEKVRHANTKLADLHLVATEEAKKRVLKLGENINSVFNVGCPSIDIAHELDAKGSLDFDPFKKYKGVGKKLFLDNGYLVVMQHPVTTEFKDSKEQVMETIDAIHQLNMPTLWFWPNIDTGSDGISNAIRIFREKNSNSNIHFFKNMYPDDFLKLLKNSLCLVGNSSVGIRESAFIGVPVVNIGSRQDNRERANNVIDTDYESSQIFKAIKTQIQHGHYKSDFLYGNGNACNKIVDILAKWELSYSKTIAY